MIKIVRILLIIAVIVALFILYKLLSFNKSLPSVTIPQNTSYIKNIMPDISNKFTQDFTAKVVSWDSAAGLLKVVYNGVENIYSIDPSDVAIFIRKSPPGGPYSETILFKKSSSNWPTAFCPGDTVEVTAPKTATGGAVIRNKGDRKCAF